ncbi:hypothetical protein GCM10010270_86510 [Streptomyces violaceus]|nr:hypothetical protein GCM10010270_86510 [Streptomyces janthinus]
MLPVALKRGARPSRRSLRPAAEYRTPTDAEWEDFLGHFERRKLSVGTCARAYGTACVHEHACVRCSHLRDYPEQHQAMRATTAAHVQGRPLTPPGLPSRARG